MNEKTGDLLCEINKSMCPELVVSFDLFGKNEVGFTFYKETRGMFL